MEIMRRQTYEHYHIMCTYLYSPLSEDWIVNYDYIESDRSKASGSIQNSGITKKIPVYYVRHATNNYMIYQLNIKLTSPIGLNEKLKLSNLNYQQLYFKLN